jgi:putative oxidoreductase
LSEKGGERVERAKAITHSLLRVVSGLLFMQFGGMGLLGWFGGVPPSGGPSPVMSQAWIGAVLQFFGGLLVTIGLFTRPAAFVISGEMAVAYFQFHQPKALFPIQNDGGGAILFCFIFLFFAANGAGEWSLDALRMRGRSAAPRKEALVN